MLEKLEEGAPAAKTDPGETEDVEAALGKTEIEAMNAAWTRAYGFEIEMMLVPVTGWPPAVICKGVTCHQSSAHRFRGNTFG